jgi:hypothetical protein
MRCFLLFADAPWRVLIGGFCGWTADEFLSGEPRRGGSGQSL